MTASPSPRARLDYVTIAVPRDIAEDWLNVIEDDHEDLPTVTNPQDFSDPHVRRAYGVDRLREALGLPRVHQREYGGPIGLDNESFFDGTVD